MIKMKFVGSFLLEEVQVPTNRVLQIQAELLEQTQ